MNGSVLKPFIRRAQEDYGIKFVYIADRYQLPPVGEDLSWVFREVRSRVVLDKVKRHDNQILNLATHLREVIDGNAKLKVADDFTEEHGGIELFTRSKAFDERILDTWEATRREAGDAEPDFSGSRVLAWRNQAVGGYNDLVREMLYGRREARDNPLMVGELLAGHRHRMGAPLAADVRVAEGNEQVVSFGHLNTRRNEVVRLSSSSASLQRQRTINPSAGDSLPRGVL